MPSKHAAGNPGHPIITRSSRVRGLVLRFKRKQEMIKGWICFRPHSQPKKQPAPDPARKGASQLGILLTRPVTGYQ